MANQEEESLSKQALDDCKQNQKLIIPLENRRKPNRSSVVYQGFCFPLCILPNIMAFQNDFQPLDADILVVTKPKSGTTWLNSLVYSIVHRTRFTNLNHPMLTKHPHQLLPSFEFNIYSLEKREEEVPLLLTNMTSPRVCSTHIPYDVLPESIKAQSKCKIVYMNRNPFDTVVSLWAFVMHIIPWLKESSLEDFIEMFCKGKEEFVPHWDHVLGYWKESLERPNKILFLQYEDMQEDGISTMKKLAEFLGCGFSDKEESDGVIHEILSLCSIDSLKNLEKIGILDCHSGIKKNAFFRKGKVGDWVNQMTPFMVKKLDEVMRDKFVRPGLEFKMYPQKQ